MVFSRKIKSREQGLAAKRLKGFSLICSLLKGLGIPSLTLLMYHSGINGTVHSHISVAIGVAQ